MHQWHTNDGTRILALINEFKNFTFYTDYAGTQEVSEVYLTGKMFSSSEEAITYVTNHSYGGDDAYIAAYTTKKLTKGYQTAFKNFSTKYNDYLKFKKDLNIAYGRKASKATCPNCGSSISLQYGKYFKTCPVCGSKKIISDSNWKKLDTKWKMCEKASESLSKEAEKNGVTFVCGIEWHC